jgi:hypothetical protein
MTVPRLVTLLRSFGILICKRQVLRLLIERQDDFLTEARDTLRAGLSSAAWITVDDTGARHKATNGFCTQIGNAHFAWFGTTGSKSRLNFLELLRAGHDDYVINAEALAYMRQRALAAHVIARLVEHPERRFVGRKAWNAHLEALGIPALKVNPDPVMVATEGALWGSVRAHGFLPDTVIVSDDAGQFNVGQHGLCWVHYLEHIFMWSGCVLTGFWRPGHITSGGRTPHNPHSVGDYRRVRGQHCRFRCGRGRRLRRTSPTGNGVMPTCQHARCTHLAAAPFPATAAMRA